MNKTEIHKTADSVWYQKRISKIIFIVLGILVVVSAIFYLMSALQHRYGALRVINQSSDLVMAESSNYYQPNWLLTGNISEKIFESTANRIPTKLNYNIGGEHSTKSYFLYLFYLKPVTESARLYYYIKVEKMPERVLQALRIRIYCDNGYCEYSVDGEGGTIPFQRGGVVDEVIIENWLSGRFAMAVWIEEKDKDYRDGMKLGHTEIAWEFDVLD